jgi:hypothetical protein
MSERSLKFSIASMREIRELRSDISSLRGDYFLTQAFKLFQKSLNFAEILLAASAWCTKCVQFNSISGKKPSIFIHAFSNLKRVELGRYVSIAMTHGT